MLRVATFRCACCGQPCRLTFANCADQEPGAIVQYIAHFQATQIAHRIEGGPYHYFDLTLDPVHGIVGQIVEAPR